MINLKPLVKTLAGKPVAVFGLGLSGLSTVRALTVAGVEVFAYDDDKETHKKAKKYGAKTKSLSKSVLKECAFLIAAPGVPYTHPKPHEVIVNAREAGIEVFGDIELLHRLKHGRKTIGMTATNGKSTTTTLIHHILTSAKKKSALGGNVGMPVMDLKMPPKDGYFTLELSSYQLDLCPTFAPDIGILLNITPDHLDRHGSMEHYASVKEKIFANPAGHAVIGVDDEICKKVYDRLSGEEGRVVVPVSVTTRLERGVYVENAVLYDAMDGMPKEVGSLSGITRLHGLHNHQNVVAAFAAGSLAGIEPAKIMDALKSYPGLPHRQYPVRVINGVAYINDSKATNAIATEKALMSFNNIYWIVGGLPKEGGLDGLEKYANKIRHAYVIGEKTNELSEWLATYNIDFYKSGTLDIAVEQAHKAAMEERGQPGGAGVVLLSPACASFDQFSSFEERGERFTALVEALEGDL